MSIAFWAVLLLILFFAIYVTADNRRILAEASGDVYQSYKPTADDSLSFDELVQINGDVIGWLTIDDTKIDYPLVQGRNNHIYINTAVSGEFSLSGSLFLDYRNSPDFTDPLSIVYGHNMAGDVMFGCLDKYSDPTFFSNHLNGSLYFKGAYYKLQVFAYFSADGHDARVYAPRADEERCRAWLERIGQIAVNRTEEIPDNGPILLLSTCSTDQTNGRDLLALSIRPGGSPPPAKGDGHTSYSGTRLRNTGEDRSPVPYLVMAGVALLMLTVLFVLLKRKKRKKDNGEQGKQARRNGA